MQLGAFDSSLSGGRKATMANTEFSFFVEDRTDGTRWTMTETGYTEQEARDKVLNRIAPHVRILRSARHREGREIEWPSR